MTVYLGPAGAPAPTNLDELGELEPLGWIKGELSPTANHDHPAARSLTATQTATFTFRASRMTSAILLGIPYKHPRQILHNGRKPR